MSNLFHGGTGLLCKGSGSAGTCATRAVHKPVCNSHLHRGDIPALGEGSFAQLMPVTPIRCWLTQAGAGQLAASPGAWKRPRCQCWCESRAPCPPRAAPYPPPCPAPGAPQQSPAPQVPLEQAPWKGGQQAAELSSLRTFAPAGTQEQGPPTAEGTCSPRCSGCPEEKRSATGRGSSLLMQVGDVQAAPPALPSCCCLHRARPTPSCVRRQESCWGMPTPDSRRCWLSSHYCWSSQQKSSRHLTSAALGEGKIICSRTRRSADSKAQSLRKGVWNELQATHKALRITM